MVAPSRFVTETLAAVAVVDVDTAFGSQVANVESTINSVTTLSVSVATRDSQTPAGAIAAGDFLGFIQGEIRAAATSLVGAVEAVVDSVTVAQLITVLVGSHVRDAERLAAVELLEQRFEGAEFEIIDGHQEVWRLIVGFE